MKAKRFSIIIALLCQFLLSALSSLAFGQSNVNVTLPDTSADAGASIAIPITVEDLTGKGIYSVGLRLTYGSSVLVATGATTNGTIASGWEAPTANPGTGEVTIGMAGTSPLSGSGVLVYVNFNVVGSPGVTTTIHFAEMTLNEGSPGTVTHDGVFMESNFLRHAGDFNSDGRVWTEDFVMFVEKFGLTQDAPSFNSAYDLNNDGRIWTEDFSEFVRLFGTTY